MGFLFKEQILWFCKERLNGNELSMEVLVVIFTFLSYVDLTDPSRSSADVHRAVNNLSPGTSMFPADAQQGGAVSFLFLLSDCKKGPSCLLKVTFFVLLSFFLVIFNCLK